MEESGLSPAIKEVEKDSDIVLLSTYVGSEDSHAEDFNAELVPDAR